MPARLPTALRPLWPQAKRTYRWLNRRVAPLTGQVSRLGGGYLPRRAVPLVDESVEAGAGRMWVARPEEQVRRAVPEGEPGRHPTFVSQADDVIPRVAVAELPGARVVRPHRVTIDARGAMIEELSSYWGTIGWREHPIFWHPFPGPPRYIPGRLAVLAGRGDHSYYHFLLDILPRLALFDAPGVPDPDRWYAPTQHPFQREILELAGFPSEAKVVDADQVPHVRAESLLVPGFPDNELRTPTWAVKFIRQRLRDPDLELIPGRRIYITRGTQRNNRTVRNEPELREMLGKRGFTVVDPGTMEVAEQIKTFAEAEWIVGPHGAALTNLAFASPGASVIEMFPPDYVQLCYWKLAHCVPGLEYRYAIGTGEPPSRGKMHGVASDMTIELATLGRMIDALPAAVTTTGGATP